MKNIAIIVPTLNKGGAERVAANLSLEFAKDYNVFVVVHDGRDVIYPYGGQLIDLRLPPARGLPGKALTLLRRTLALRKIKKEHHIDISISHLPASNYVNCFSRQGDQVYTYVHCMEDWSRGTALRESLTAKLSDWVVCVSECVRKNMIETFRVPSEKAITVYNFCDLVPSAPAKGEGGFTIATMGRLTEQKGQWHLIRAMKKVAAELGPEVRLVIVGEGELRQSLEDLARQLGVGEQVVFTGFLQDPWAELQRADLYVSSSLWEGLPMALVEAGCCGLPILSTDCDAGCREILAPDTPVDYKTDRMEEGAYGVLLPVCLEGDLDRDALTREEEIMADAVIALARDPALRAKYAKLARERSLDFHPDRIMAQWHQRLE